MTRRGCGCCEGCETYFDLNVNDLASFNAGILYSGGQGTFDGTLRPGETIRAVAHLPGDLEESFYRVFADLRQPAGPPGPLEYEWEGVEIGSGTIGVPLDITVPNSASHRYKIEIDWEHTNWGQVRAYADTPSGTTQERYWEWGSLTGNGYAEYRSGIITPNAPFGSGTWWTNLSMLSGIGYIYRVKLIFVDLEGDPGPAEYPMEFLMEARNVDDQSPNFGDGWSLQHMKSTPAGLDGRMFCDSIEYQGDTYELRQETEGRFWFDSSDGFVQRGYAQVDWVEADSDYRHWVGDASWYKPGDPQPYANVGVGSFIPEPKTGFIFEPLADVRSWEDEIGPQGPTETTLEFAPATRTGDRVIPTLPKGSMLDLEVMIENTGQGDILVDSWSAKQTQGADPDDGYNCPSTAPQPGPPPVNADCDRWTPPCDGLGPLRHLLWKVDKPRPPTSLGFGFADLDFATKQICEPGGNSFCEIVPTTAGIDLGDWIYGSEWPIGLVDGTYPGRIQLISDGPLDPVSCDPSDPQAPSYDRRGRYERIFVDWTPDPLPADTIFRRYNPVQTIDWQFFATLERIPGTTRANLSGTLNLYHVNNVQYDQSGPGAISVWTVPLGESLSFGKDPDNCDPQSPSCDFPGIFFDREIANTGSVRLTASPIKSTFDLGSIEVDLCDLVPGWTHRFEITGQNLLTIAGEIFCWQEWSAAGAYDDKSTVWRYRQPCGGETEIDISYATTTGFIGQSANFRNDPSVQVDIDGTYIDVEIEEWPG